MIYAVGPEGDPVLTTLGLDVGRMLSHRLEPWAVVEVLGGLLTVRFAPTAWDAATQIATALRDDHRHDDFTAASAVMECLQRQAHGLH